MTISPGINLNKFAYFYHISKCYDKYYLCYPYEIEFLKNELYPQRSLPAKSHSAEKEKSSNLDNEYKHILNRVICFGSNKPTSYNTYLFYRTSSLERSVYHSLRI